MVFLPHGTQRSWCMKKDTLKWTSSGTENISTRCLARNTSPRTTRRSCTQKREPKSFLYSSSCTSLSEKYWNEQVCWSWQPLHDYSAIVTSPNKDVYRSREADFGSNSLRLDCYLLKTYKLFANRRFLSRSELLQNVSTRTILPKKTLQNWLTIYCYDNFHSLPWIQIRFICSTMIKLKRYGQNLFLFYEEKEDCEYLRPVDNFLCHICIPNERSIS